MSTYDSNPCFPFDADEPQDPKDVAPFDFDKATFESLADRMRHMEGLDEFTLFATAASCREGLFSLVRSAALQFIDEQQYWRWENCTSVYDFCARQEGNALAIGRGTVCADLKVAKTLSTISGYSYCDSINDYLVKEGNSQGRGMPSSDGTRLVFRLIDFVGHVSKLGLLQSLIAKGKTDIDWHEFFSDGFDEYEDYVKKLIGPRNKPAMSSFGTGSHRPGRMPKEKLEGAEEDQETTLQDLDPFADAFSRSPELYEPSESITPIGHHLDPIDFKDVPLGTLGDNPIFGDTNLYRDPGFAERAFKSLREDVRHS
jgi:hypothetical protein